MFCRIYRRGVKNINKEKEMYYNKSQLKKRGWTDSIIKKMSLTPDLLKQNPFYKKASQMKLYLTKSIEELENTEQFIKLIEKSAKRKKSAIKSVEKKTNNLINYVESLKITVQKISLERLKKYAIANYNDFESHKSAWDHNYEPNYYEPNDYDSDFLARIQVNYIRHQLTSYDKELKGMLGKTGKCKAYEILKNRVLDEIAKQYPTLENECQKQKLNGSEKL